jgi:hypothetical protein
LARRIFDAERWKRRCGTGAAIERHEFRNKSSAANETLARVAERISLSKICNFAMRGEADIANLGRLALTILHTVGEAEAQFVGKAVTLTDGTAGTVEAVWLDDFHGLRLSIRGHPGKRPVSTVKFTQG